MDAYEKFLKSCETLDKGKSDGSRRESGESRVGVALDVDEAVQRARKRLDEFVRQYLPTYEGLLAQAAHYREHGMKESVVARMEEEALTVTFATAKPNTIPAVLRLDDLRILLGASYRLWGPGLDVQPDE